MGRIGHEFVREHFLLTRHVRDYLTMLLCLDHPEQHVFIA
jgi:trehalose synthase